MANVEMFKKIRDQIKSEPKGFYMGSWESPAFSADPDLDYIVDFYVPETDEWDVAPVSECGTQRCVAGWAIYFRAEEMGLDLSRPLRDLAIQVDPHLGESYALLGEAVLDIDRYEANSLFYGHEDEAYRIVDDYAEGRRG